ncbi:MAG: filamentous hemagglutinin N-terminal domain-containing protein [Aestuariibacter sp.]|nr:filamentous hemagglutinin N-terminal domain-containing protein [Aestuariibacter sp.]
MEKRLKQTTALTSPRKALSTMVIGMALVLLPVKAFANPQGTDVKEGSVVIVQETAKKLGITQHTDKAAINWNSFNIGADEHTQFYQPSASSITLNRVTGGNPSEILGRLSANGRVMIINPDGILFGRNSQIDVSALVASTHDIRDADFMAGKYDFTIPGNPTASIINQGTITIKDSGLAAFVAPGVSNQGVIAARLGKVALASANGFTLDLYGDGLINLVVADKVAQQAIDSDGKPLANAVDNTGTIKADGGYVLLTANAARGVVNNVVNSSGVIEANSIGEQGGKIVFGGGDEGDVTVSGTLNASGEGNAMGGEIRVTANDKLTVTESASIKAEGGETGGDGGFLAMAGSQTQFDGSYSVKATGAENGWLYVGADTNTANVMRNPNAEGAGKKADTATVLFEENKGQTDSNIDYLTRADGGTLFLTAAEAFARLRDGEDSTTTLGMGLSGANADAEVTGEDKLASYSNYYIGNDESKWVEGAGHYGQIRYSDIYEGIDLVYYGNKAGDIEYDLVVAAGADASQIRFDYSGVENIRLNSLGDLLITTGDQTVIQKTPLTYQNTDKARMIVPSSYVVNKSGKVNIKTSDYNQSNKLVVDPVIAWSSYLGGGSDEEGASVAVDNNGNIFLTGSTSSSNFDTTNSFDNIFGGATDAYITKLTPAGVIAWSTYQGGSGVDKGRGVAIDSSSNAYVTGDTTSTDFNALNGFATSYGGGIVMHLYQK